jgi:hypothetical protein
VQLKLIRHLWGLDEPWETLFPKILASGYAGVEGPVPPAHEQHLFRDLLARYRLDFVAYVPTLGSSVEEHLESLRRGLDEAAAWEPLLVGCHGGRDVWPLSEAARFFRGALEAERATGLPVAHETHRGRPLFNPWAARELLPDLPDLKLSADFSHWVVVAERLLEDEADLIRMVAHQVHHIHARVGYSQGPQAPDPRAPEYAAELAAHEEWWDMVWDSQERRGMAVSTLTPEFGPPPYLHTLPYTGEPVANLWDICDWQARRQAARFAARR